MVYVYMPSYICKLYETWTCGESIAEWKVHILGNQIGFSLSSVSSFASC